MDRTDSTLVTLRAQNDALHTAALEQSAVNKAIRDELESIKEIVATHGDVLSQMVDRLEEMQAKIDEHEAVITAPPVWTTSAEASDLLELDFQPASAINQTPPAPVPVAKTAAQIEAEKVEKAKAKAERALASRG